MGRGRSTKEMMAERLAFKADMMIRLRSFHKTVQTVRQKYGVNERTVAIWISKVRAQWRAEASKRDPEEARDDIRETLNAILALALGRSQVVKDAEGNPVMREQILPDGRVIKEPAVRANPDLQRAIHALRDIMHLDGLARPLTAQIRVDHEVAKLPDLAKAGGAEAARALQMYLAAIAPGADVSELAGEWFKLSGDEAPKN
jgi:hypothetical protein